ncbi:MAG: endonuclease/exonuclease/phosphatase family protein [Candidatus Binataceae bacterium]
MGRLESGPFSLKLVSWNVHGLPWPASRDRRRRIHRIARKILDLRPDLVFLQEVWLNSDARYLRGTLGPDYVSIFQPRSRGTPGGGLVVSLRSSDGWTAAAPPEFRCFQSSAPRWKVWEGDGLGGKGILTIEVRRDARRLFLVDTHLQSQYARSDYAAVREAQITELEAWADRLDPQVPALIAGDFNTDYRESSLYTKILAIGADLTESARQRCGHGTVLDGTGSWIDYVLLHRGGDCGASSDFELILSDAPDRPYSDHHALSGTIHLPRW